jgi:2-dehydropantoate 2-reductase
VRVPAVEHPGDLEVGEGDVVVLAMKTQDTERALTELAAVAPPSVPVVCAQNGVENERLALRRFPAVHAMCVMLPATFLEPGVVVAHGTPQSGILDVGRYPAGVDDTTVEVAAALDASGFSSRADPAVMRLKHAKLLLNLANALEAASGPDGRRSTLVARAKREALACYAAAASTLRRRRRRRSGGGTWCASRRSRGRSGAAGRRGRAWRGGRGRSRPTTSTVRSSCWAASTGCRRR